jgi:hypothetical protein
MGPKTGADGVKTIITKKKNIISLFFIILNSFRNFRGNYKSYSQAVSL